MVDLNRHAVGRDLDREFGVSADHFIEQAFALGVRCVTMTMASPGRDGMPWKNPSSASMPPAEAPTPMIGNSGEDVIGLSLP